MGKTTPARQKAIGTIGLARVQKLEDAGLVVFYRQEYEQLAARVADLERTAATLREIVSDSAQINVVAAQVLKEAMGR